MTRRATLGFMPSDAKPADRGSVTLVAVLAQASAASQTDDVAEIRRRLMLILRMGHEAAIGVPVSVAAQQLALSQPTVRAWIDRGVLRTVPGQTPTRITADSLGEVLAVITDLRATHAKGPLAGRVVHALQDRRDRAALVGRFAELDKGDWVSVDFDDLDELFA